MYKELQDCHRRLPFLHKFCYIYNVLHLQSVTGDYLSSLAASCSTCSLHPRPNPILCFPNLGCRNIRKNSFVQMFTKVCKTILFALSGDNSEIKWIFQVLQPIYKSGNI